MAGLMLSTMIAATSVSIPDQIQQVNRDHSLSFVTSSKEILDKFTASLLQSNNARSSSQGQYITESESAFHKTETRIIGQDFRNGQRIVHTQSIARSSKPTSWQSLALYYKQKKSTLKVKTLKDLVKAGEPQPPDHRRNWVPTYIGSVPARVGSSVTLNWSNAPCFKQTSARITNVNPQKKTLILEFETENATSLTCYDWYFITTRQNYYVKVLYFKGKHEMSFEGLNSESGEWEDIMENGLRIFEFKDAIVSI